MRAAKAIVSDWLLARYLGRRARLSRNEQLIQRRSDATLWIAGCPQNIGYAMRGLWSKNPGWHFYRARKWRGLIIASRRVFWMPESGSEFTFPQKVPAFILPPWPEEIECERIDSMNHKKRALSVCAILAAKEKA